MNVKFIGFMRVIKSPNTTGHQIDQVRRQLMRCKIGYNV